MINMDITSFILTCMADEDDEAIVVIQVEKDSHGKSSKNVSTSCQTPCTITVLEITM